MTDKKESSKSDSERPVDNESGKKGAELPEENFRPIEPVLLHEIERLRQMTELQRPIVDRNLDEWQLQSPFVDRNPDEWRKPIAGLNLFKDCHNLVDINLFKEKDEWRKEKEKRLKEEEERRKQEEQRYRTMYCNRCSKMLVGKYYTMKKPNGETAELCPICLRMVRVRLRILNSKPNYEAKKIIKEALKDLKRAAKYDPEDQQIQANIRNVKSILAVTNGSLFGNMLFFLLNKWVLLSVAASIVLTGWIFRFQYGVF